MWQSRVSALCLQAHPELLNHQLLGDPGSPHLDICTEEKVGLPETRCLTEFPGIFARKHLPHSPRNTPGENFQLSQRFPQTVPRPIDSHSLYAYMCYLTSWVENLAIPETPEAIPAAELTLIHR